MDNQTISTGDQKSMQGQESDKIDRIKLHRAREKTTNLQLLLHYIYTLYYNYFPTH